MQKIVAFIVFLITFVGLTNTLAFGPFDKYQNRDLSCPPVELTELMGQPGGIYKMKNGQLCAECGYFVKTAENKWSSALIVRACWVEDPAAEQFDCAWKDMKDPFRYMVSKDTQAYAEVVSYDRQRFGYSFRVLGDLFDQVKNLAISCPGKRAHEEEKRVATSGSPSTVARGKVIMTRGKDVMIQPDEGQPKATQGDTVKLSFSVGGEVISVGTWRVSTVKGDGTVEAKPVEPQGDPNIDMDAIIYVKSQELVKETAKKKKQVKDEQPAGVEDKKSQYEMACEKGDAAACTRLGLLYDTGEGVKQDYARALELYAKACDGGNAMGCYNQGLMYALGKGIKKDYRRAAELYQKGCAGGNAMGCTNLGILYRDGKGVNKDYNRAIELCEKGCKGGNSVGCANLGWMYYKGIGTAPDQTRARSLFEQACSMGNQWSCDKLKELSN